MAGALALDVERRYPGGAVVRAALTVPVEPPGVTVLLGPSGAGKTTILRCVAGLHRPDRGTVRFGEEVWSDAASGRWVPPQRRRVGFLHQEPALFPHRSVRGNVAFGLRRLPQAERGSRVAGLLDRFGLTALADRRPGQLSGGERQRVALARALGPSPRLLLLDEPLSALDPPTRGELRLELRRDLIEAGVPSLLVTHDRTEAMVLGDRIAVVIRGEIRQEVVLRLDESVAESARNHLTATVVAIHREGPLERIVLDCGFELAAVVTPEARRELGLARGKRVVAAVKAPAVHRIPRAGVRG